jgi:hypothetical protein
MQLAWGHGRNRVRQKENENGACIKHENPSGNWKLTRGRASFLTFRRTPPFIQASYAGYSPRYAGIQSRVSRLSGFGTMWLRV